MIKRQKMCRQQNCPETTGLKCEWRFFQPNALKMTYKDIR